jgi:hypothetical protein
VRRPTENMGNLMGVVSEIQKGTADNVSYVAADGP